MSQLLGFAWGGGLGGVYPRVSYTRMPWEHLVYHVPAPGVLFLSIRSKSFEFFQHSTQVDVARKLSGISSARSPPTDVTVSQTHDPRCSS